MRQWGYYRGVSGKRGCYSTWMVKVTLWRPPAQLVSHETSCRRAAATICPARALSSFVGAEGPRAGEPTAPADVTATWPQCSSRFPRPIRPRSLLQLPDALRPRWVKRLVTLTFDIESGVRGACDVGYPCANFGLPRPLSSRPWPDVRDRHRRIIA